MENEERKIVKVYAIVTIYTIILLAGGILLGFVMGRQSVISEREIQQSDTLQVERVNRSLMTEDNLIERDLLNHIKEL